MRGRVLVAVQFGSLAGIWFTPSGFGFVAGGPSQVWRWVFAAIAPTSTALFVVAVALVAAAYLALRPAFRVLPEPAPGAPFIVTGIYRYIRHPMYTAVIAFGASMALTRNPRIAWPLLAVLVADLWVKSRYEDTLLRQRHPDAAAYQQRVGRFLPRLRRA